jgi:hypothetical protein
MPPNRLRADRSHLTGTTRHHQSRRSRAGQHPTIHAHGTGWDKMPLISRTCCSGWCGRDFTPRSALTGSGPHATLHTWTTGTTCHAAHLDDRDNMPRCRGTERHRIAVFPRPPRLFPQGGTSCHSPNGTTCHPIEVPRSSPAARRDLMPQTEGCRAGRDATNTLDFGVFGLLEPLELRN